MGMPRRRSSASAGEVKWTSSPATMRSRSWRGMGRRRVSSPVSGWGPWTSRRWLVRRTWSPGCVRMAVGMAGVSGAEGFGLGWVGEVGGLSLELGLELGLCACFHGRYGF